MNLTNETYAPLRVLVDEFVRAGIRHAVIAPGSRNAPIAYTLADREELTTWSVLDERSAGFFALGIAKSRREPVIVTCSSGTAAANLHPAVIEASHAGVPLIVLTADRPPELRDTGAGQAIDQIKLYGETVRWFVEAGNHPLSDETLRHFRALGCRAVAVAGGLNPGPVHLNFSLREPLHPVPADLGELEAGDAALGRANGEPWTDAHQHLSAGPDFAELFNAARRPLIVAGEQHTPGLADAIAKFAGERHIPVLADALSQLRRHGITGRAAVVCAYDAILRDAVAREHLAPDLILRVGETPTSKPLRSWMAEQDCRQITIDPRGAWHEPTRKAHDVWQCDAVAAFESASNSKRPANEVAVGWANTWRAIEIAAQSAIDTALAAEPFPFEPSIYREGLRALRSGATVWVSSSMPVRDVECFAAPGRDDVRLLSNRGANGIDGVLSSALGAAVSFDCDRVVLLTGDLALLYDVNALALMRMYEIPLTIICVDNDGGGIFSFLPIAEHKTHFERLIATPSGVNIEAVVRSFGIEYCAPDGEDELRGAIERPGLIHFRTDRTANREGHERVNRAVVEAVSAALAESGALR